MEENNNIKAACSEPQSPILRELDMSRIPQHIAIIMDGNGRWAIERGLDRTYGHKEGVETVRLITSECVRLGVKYLTLYTFSTENWNRPAEEVSALMGLVLSSLEDEIFMKNNVRFRVIGDRSRLPDIVDQKLKETEEHTANNTRMTVVVALSYSSRWEITNAVKQIVREVHDMEELPKNILKNWRTGGIRSEDITEDFISQHLCTNFMPDPDLLIRTGGELRISNYLLWQIAYSELYFCDTYWPDFKVEDLYKAIASYQSRQRRYGKTEAQVEGEEK
jgi:undecaprenyl diphosphate synthase